MTRRQALDGLGAVPHGEVFLCEVAQPRGSQDLGDRQQGMQG
ncbi:MAG TPA: hypothetical protein VE645_13475 [Pseudonocardiaceae bacterium]|nr:hypothetical protein [Pseudonocardiaceae bacterium]